MGTIIVTTDQSVSSKSAIRFAIDLAVRRKAELVILHVYHVFKPLIWSENAYQVYKHAFVSQTEKDLTVFIRKIIKAMNLSDVKFKLIMTDHVDVTEGILEVAAQYQCDYICIGTRGAGMIKKIIGTHTSNLITHSKHPVICIPSGYRRRPLKRMLYATDMNDYEAELSQLIAFARPLQVELRMMHVASNNGLTVDKALAEASIDKKFGYKVEVLNLQWNALHSVLHEIGIEAEHYNPSMIAFFTNQNDHFLKHFLLLSNAAEYSFYGRVPVISFKKK